MRVLKEIGWPQFDLKVKQTLKDEFSSLFLLLLELDLSTSQLQQKGREEKVEEEKISQNSKREDLVEERRYWVFELMNVEFRKKFNFHFERKNSSLNNLKKPEWLFNLLLEWIKLASPFFSNLVQPLLLQFYTKLYNQTKGSEGEESVSVNKNMENVNVSMDMVNVNVGMNMVNVNVNEKQVKVLREVVGKEEWMREVVLMLNDKLEEVLELVGGEESLFCGFLNETIHFCTDLSLAHSYRFSLFESPLSVFSNPPYLYIWLQIEKNCNSFHHLLISNSFLSSLYL